MAAIYQDIPASPTQTAPAVAANTPGTPEAILVDDNYEFHAPMYYDFEKPSPIGLKVDAWFEHPDYTFDDSEDTMSPSHSPISFGKRTSDITFSKARDSMHADAELNHTPVKVLELNSFSKPSVQQVTPLRLSANKENANPSVGPNSIMNIPHPNKLTQKQPPNKAAPAPAPAPAKRRFQQVVVKPIDPAKLAQSRIPKPSAPMAGAVGTRATPAAAPRPEQIPKTRSPTRHLAPSIHEKTPSFKSKPAVQRSLAAPVAHPSQIRRPVPKQAQQKPQIMRAPVMRKIEHKPTITRKPEIPKQAHQAVRRPIAPVTNQVVKKQAPPQPIARTAPSSRKAPIAQPPASPGPMTYAQVAASPAKPQKSFMRPTAAMQAKHLAALKLREQIDKKKTQEEYDLVIHRTRHFMDHEIARCTPETLRRVREMKAMSLTVPITPPFLKRAQRSGREPATPSEQRALIEAARARQQFLDEQRRRREQWERKKAALAHQGSSTHQNQRRLK